ncbi:hypothetical protein [Bradyrhizobium ivorense]|uniref:hypothetical protein n=1 Tax=Bradyrhizobium ivorense TaxID=2511166 RepID=UPI0010BC6BA4|nr:hypothetical protein [Bradyrhizobium ivorense]VIO73912.1 hypothetical protein CI41S_40210 [Bradyrhizobium ivorense]
MFGRLPGLVLLFALALAAPAHANGPGSEFKRVKDAKVITSPDGKLRVEQYARDMGDDGMLFQFWTFDRARKNAFPLNEGETTDQAGFRFSPDSQWLVRMQKIGSGTQTLHLYYKHSGDRFAAATDKPLGDAAWDYFFTQPAAKVVRYDPQDPYSLDHMQAGLIKGLEDNYAWLGQHWPDSRYLVIGLSFDIQGEDTPFPWVEDWRCLYDLKTGTFSVPEAFAEHNAKAWKTPDPDRKSR